MLDEWFEKKVDEACEAIPAYANPRKIRLANSAVGWRLYLYGSSMKRAVMSALVHIRSEDDMNLFMRETAEKSARLAYGIYKRGTLFDDDDNDSPLCATGCILPLSTSKICKIRSAAHSHSHMMH